MTPKVSYYLEGFDREPIKSSKEDLGQVSYTNLKGGTYTFHLDLEDESGEARRASVTIVKMKAFYEQPVLACCGFGNAPADRMDRAADAPAAGTLKWENHPKRSWRLQTRR